MKDEGAQELFPHDPKDVQVAKWYTLASFTSKTRPGPSLIRDHVGKQVSTEKK